MSRQPDIDPISAETARDRPVRRALGLTILLLLLGTCGFMWIEGWDLWKSFFFTVITLSTVGYGDYGMSDAGLKFAAVLILGGFGVITYSVGQLAPVLFNQRLAREWKMKRRIFALNDHFIICGLGRVGRAVCTSLAQDNVPFVAIDPNSGLVDLAAEAGHLALVGDAACDDVLMEAGVDRARGLACVTGSDTENIVITLSARQLNPNLFIICRAEHSGTARKVMRAGATRVLSPIRAGGESIANAMARPHLADLLHHADDSGCGVEMAEILVTECSALEGCTFQDCAKTHGAVVFVAVKPHDDSLRFQPAAEDSLQGGDVLIVAGDALAIGRLQDAARRMREAA